MSGIPPNIPPQINTDPGTPSQEWARSTTTAAFARSDPAPAQPNSSSTPGVSIGAADSAQRGEFDPTLASGQVPGAYPATPGEHPPHDSLAETAQAAAEHASKFMQSAATTAAQYIPQSVVDTVSSYIPTSTATATMSTARASAHDDVHTTSFPSAELSGARSGERVGGVGSLPGPVNESAVPKLPSERTADEQYTTAAGATAILAGGASALRSKVVGAVPSHEPAKQSGTGTAHPTHSTAITASTLPTHEPFGARPGDRSLGVGALPGSASESNVALLPEESAHPAYDSGPGGVDGRAQVGLKPSEERAGNDAEEGMRHVGGVGALVGGPGEEGVARLPDERGGAGAGVGEREQEEQAHAMSADDGPKPPAPSAKHESEGAKDEGAASAAKKELGGSGKGQPNKLLGDPGSSPGDAQETQTDQLHVQLRPRGHALGAAHARWGSVPLDGPSVREEVEGPGYDADYHPAAMHPRSESDSHPHPHSPTTESRSDSHSDSHAPQPPSHSPDNPSSSPSPTGGAEQDTQRAKKASFMAKMKGEAKVLIGKIEKRGDKVEEGMRVKSGESAPATT